MQVYQAHAQLELDINGEPEVALRAMKLGRMACPAVCSDPAYILLMVKIFMRLQKILPIRWLFQSVLGEQLPATSKSSNGFDLKEFTSSVKTPAVRAQLWEEYYRTELAMGECNLTRLNEIREQSLRARALVPQPPPPLAQSAAAAATACGFFEYPLEIFERHAQPCLTWPVCDASLKNRCRGSAYIDDLARAAENEQAAIDSNGKRKWQRHGRDAGGLEADNVLLAGLPAFFKELLVKLPPLNGSSPDIDSFVDSLRRTILPPRPSEETLFNTGKGVEKAGLKRPRVTPSGDIRDSADVIEDGGTVDLAGDLDLDTVEDSSFDRDDVFRRRQRKRLENEDF
jgi:hypothetical protein